jgi:hypothetical protein
MEKSKEEIALKLLQRGESFNTVMEITGVNKSTLQQLLQQETVEVA